MAYETAATTNYKELTADDLLMGMLEDAQDEGLISDDSRFMDYIRNRKSIESTMIMDFSVICGRVAQLAEQLTLHHRNTDLDKAVMEGLVNLGKLFFPPLPASYSIGEVTCLTKLEGGVRVPSPETVDIPVGWTVFRRSDTNIYYKSTAAAQLLQGSTEVTLPIMCLDVGPIGNAPVNTITEVEYLPTYVDEVTNQYVTTGGKPAETADEYRARLRNWPYSLSTGTGEAVTFALDSQRAIRGYSIEQFWRGKGSVRIIYDPPTQVIKDTVESAVKPVIPLDEDYTYYPVELVEINSDLVCNTDVDRVIPLTRSEKDDLEIILEGYAQTYINGGLNRDGTEYDGMSIGEDFVPWLLSVFLKNQVSELKNFQSIHPATPVTILPHQKAVAGTVSITVI